jgi:ribosomal protein L23
MAIFGNKKNTGSVQDVKDERGKLSTALLAPWLSEKALIQTEKSVYTFHIPKEATKRDVELAVKKIYNVTPVKVNVVNLPAKKVTLRTRRGYGMRSARRKAYVYLKKGDTIQFA